MNVKILAFVLVLCILPFQANAQTNNTSTEDKGNIIDSTKEIITDAPKDFNVSIPNSRWMELNTMVSSLEKRVDALEKDSTRLAQQISTLEGNLNTERSKNVTAQSDIANWKEKYEDLGRSFSNASEDLARLCLLYPLEIRYNQEFHSNVLNTFVTISAALPESSKKGNFIWLEDNAKPLLEHYKDYNQQMIDFFTQTLETVTKTYGEVGHHRELFLNNLHNVDYYKNYYNKNAHITYLDLRIKKFLQIMNKKGKVEMDLQQIIDELKPKTQAK